MTLSDLGIFSLIDGIDLSEKTRTSGLGSMTKINDSQPVKFNQGGAVQRFDNGGLTGVPYHEGAGDHFFPLISGKLPTVQDLIAKRTPDPVKTNLQDIYETKLKTYKDILSDPEEIEKRKDLAEAGILFDIAQAGLTFAAPMPGEPSGLSGAERLALAAKTSEVLPKISERTVGLQDKIREEERAIKLASLQAAEVEKKELDAAEAARKLKEMELAAETYTLSEGEEVYNREGKLIASGPGKTHSLSPGENVYDKDGNIIVHGPAKLYTGKPGEVLFGLDEKGEARDVKTIPHKPVTLSEGQTLVDNNGKIIASGNLKKYTLSEGQVIYDAAGNEIAKGPPKTYSLSRGQIVIDSNGMHVATAPGEQVVLSEGQILYNIDSKTIEAEGNSKKVTLSPGVVLADANDGRVIARGDNKTVSLAPGTNLVDEKTGKVITEGPEKYFTLSEGQILRDRFGNKIAEGDGKNYTLSEGQILLDKDGNKIAEGLPKHISPQYQQITNLRNGHTTVADSSTPEGKAKIADANLNPNLHVSGMQAPADAKPKNVMITELSTGEKYAGIYRESRNTLEYVNLDGGKEVVKLGTDKADKEYIFNPISDATANEFIEKLNRNLDVKKELYFLDQQAVAENLGKDLIATAVISKTNKKTGEKESEKINFDLRSVAERRKYETLKRQYENKPLKETGGVEVTFSDPKLHNFDGSLKDIAHQFGTTEREGMITLADAEAGVGISAGIRKMWDKIPFLSDFTEAIGMEPELTRRVHEQLKHIVLVGRPALVQNPRSPVTEMDKIELAFPDINNWFRDVKAEVGKLVLLRQLALNQKRFNYDQMHTGNLSDKEYDKVKNNNVEIENLIYLLDGIVDSNYGKKVQSENEELVESAREAFRSAAGGN
jgi:hypothetical protein